jgi:hypothetical protein
MCSGASVQVEDRWSRERAGEPNSDMDLGVVRGTMPPGVVGEAGAEPTMESRLARELTEHGHRFRVESRGGLAILSYADGEGLAAIDPPLRRWLVQAARRAGFTHVAVEIPDDPADFSRETLPGHQPP